MIYIVVLILVLVVLALPFLVGRRSNDLSPFEGKIPMVPSAYFRCAEHDYKKLVSLYNHDDPPTCPICGKNLVKGGE